MNDDFDVLQKTWNNYGKKQTYWSVITAPEYKDDKIEFTCESFFLGGIKDIQTFENIANQYNRSLVDKNILDFGCGVGRLSLALSRHAKSVLGVDISTGHLEKAEEHMLSNNIENVNFKLIESQLSDILTEKFDAIISLIVLQHNRPELMKSMIKQLLSFLNDDGFALLHIPYYIPNYTKKTGTTHVMEMHFLPIFEIDKLAQECGFLMKQHSCDFCGGGIKNAIFYFTK